MFRQISEEKSYSIITNCVCIIIDLFGWYKFYEFYNMNRNIYGKSGMYTVNNAIKIVGEDGFRTLMFWGFLVMIVTALSVLSSIYFCISSINELKWKFIIGLFAIVNIIVAYFSIKYYIIGILVIGIIAGAYSLLHSTD